MRLDRSNSKAPVDAVICTDSSPKHVQHLPLQAIVPYEPLFPPFCTRSL